MTHFRLALQKDCGIVAEGMIESNSLMQDYFIGEEVNFGTENNIDRRKISAEEWVDFFEWP